MGIFGVFYFEYSVYLGGVDPLYGNDTAEYIKMYACRPPLYPSFLAVLRVLFGERIYIYIAILFQTLFAAWIVSHLLELLCDTYQLEKHRFAKNIIFILLLLTYYKADEYHPGCNLWILTEGLAYSLFYLFIYFSIKFLREKTFLEFVKLLISTSALILCRTQFIVCLGMVVCYVLYLLFSKKINLKRLFFLLFVTALSTVFISVVQSGYKRIADKTNLNTYSILESRTNIYAYLTLEDVLKIENESERKLFLDIYDEIVENGYEYKGNTEKWLDRVDSYYNNLLKLRGIVLSNINNYIRETGIEDESEIDKLSGILLERQVKILYSHLGLWVYDSLKSLPITMIKVIAFYPENIHMRVLRKCFMIYSAIIYGLYIVANIALCIWKKGLQIENVFCGFLLLFTLANAAITEMFMCSLIRYVAYSFGLFYISGLLVVMALHRQFLIVSNNKTAYVC